MSTFFGSAVVDLGIKLVSSPNFVHHSPVHYDSVNHLYPVALTDDGVLVGTKSQHPQFSQLEVGLQQRCNYLRKLSSRFPQYYG